MGERDWARETGRERLGEPPHIHAKNDRQTVLVSYPHEAVVDPQLQPLVLASHAAGHFVIRGATRTLRYLRGFQHSAHRSLLAGSLWSSRTSSASDMVSSGPKRTWLSRPSASPCLCSLQDISSRYPVYRHANRLAAESRARTAAITYGRIALRANDDMQQPPSFFLAILRSNRRAPGFNLTSRHSAARRHGGLSRDPHPTQRAPNLVLLLAPRTLSLLPSVVFSLL
jgi:hypothetical protein